MIFILTPVFLATVLAGFMVLDNSGDSDDLENKTAKEQVLSMRESDSLDIKDDSPEDQKTAKAGFLNVNPQEAKDLIDQNKGNPDFQTIDIRTSQEQITDGYIADSILIDFYQYDFTKNLSQLDKNKTYLIYCKTGNRSEKTLEMMQELSFKQVYNLRGGINNWKDEGLPLKT